MKFFTIICLNILISLNLLAQSSIQWEKSYGGSGSDVVLASISTSDGGYLIGATTESLDGVVAGNHGSSDVWLIKTANNGTLQWQKCLGDLNTDGIAALVELSDGGYAVLASTRSNGTQGLNQVYGNHGSQDLWLAIVDESGDFLWSKCYGGDLQEDARALIQKTDGSLVLVGNTLSFEMVDSSGIYGGWNGYVLGVSPDDGAILWERVIGGTGSDYLYAALETPQGNLTLTGVSSSINGALFGTFNHGTEDLWVCQINTSGNILWNFQYGGSQNDGSRALCQTASGNYIITGNTRSTDGDVSGFYGLQDAWVLYLSENGALIWNRVIGGADNDSGFAIAQRGENEFIWAGETSSIDGNITGHHGGRDALVVTMDFDGNMLELTCLGGSANDFTRSIIPVGTSGMIIAGTSSSSDGDVSQNNGNFDAWMVKFGNFVGVTPDLQNASSLQLDISPNPATEQVTINTDYSGFKTWLVYNLQGKLMQSIENEDNSLTLPVKSYPAGVYFVKMVSPTGMVGLNSFVKE